MELIEEKIILKNLICNPEYFSKVIPYLRKEQFTQDRVTMLFFKYIQKFNEIYNKAPTPSVMSLVMDKDKTLSQEGYKEAKELIEYCKSPETFELDWLINQTNDFIQAREYFIAISDAAEKFEKNELDKELPEKLEKALSVTFDNNIGMSFEDAEARWEAYTKHEDKIPFGLNKLNEITKDGVTKKTLNCVMSSNTGGCKSLFLVHLSCDYIRQGKNVLYLSFEMAEDKVMERFDANMMDIPIDGLVNLGKSGFVSRVEALKKASQGRFIVKQFPTSVCHVGHIRALLRELKLKQHFVPEVIMVDYIGIMASMRYSGSNTPEHIILKSISEELRGLAIEENVIIFTASQSNRNGSTSGADLSMADISASYGTVFGYDLLLGIVVDKFDEEHKMLVIQLKNRYEDMNKSKKFFLGLSKEKMKLFDIDDANYNTDIVFTNEQEEMKENANARKSMTVFSNRFAQNHNQESKTKFVFD